MSIATIKNPTLEARVIKAAIFLGMRDAHQGLFEQTLVERHGPALGEKTVAMLNRENRTSFRRAKAMAGCTRSQLNRLIAHSDEFGVWYAEGYAAVMYRSFVPEKELH